MNRAPNGIRTRVTAVKGRCPRPLDDGDVFEARKSYPRLGERPNPLPHTQ